MEFFTGEIGVQEAFDSRRRRLRGPAVERSFDNSCPPDLLLKLF
jgi:hypothetical protein